MSRLRHQSSQPAVDPDLPDLHLPLHEQLRAKDLLPPSSFRGATGRGLLRLKEQSVLPGGVQVEEYRKKLRNYSKVERYVALPEAIEHADEKARRGSHDYRCNGYVFVCKWNDSAVVSVASNYCTHLPKKKAARRVGKEIVHVPQPFLIGEYNHGMGGVDLLYQLLSDYRPNIKGKKWWWPLLINALNLSVVAAWRIYCHLHSNSKPSQLQFRQKMVITLLKRAETNMGVCLVGTAVLPVDVRVDGEGHSMMSTTEGRCVVCSKNTRNVCAKCKVRLHYSHGKDCFQVFHSSHF